MNEGLERLKEIGAKKIYEDTHIPAGPIQTIIDGKFDNLSKLQFLGFISILEREYGCDLSDIREKGETYFDELQANKEVVINESIYKAPSKRKNFMLLYSLVAGVIFIVAVIFTMSSSGEDVESITKLNNKIIEDIHENIVNDANRDEQEENTEDIEQNIFTNEQNSSAALADQNITELTTQEELVKEPEVLPNTTFEIVPRKRVWFGYIDLTNHKRYQKTFRGKLTLDPSKEWLLFFGHGNVNVVTDNGVKRFTTRNALRLHYKDGELERISAEEFKRLNGGRKW